MSISCRRIAILALASLSACSFGQLVTLADNGSVAQINAGTGNQGFSGLNNWTIGDGPNNVVQQVYAYRVGNGTVDEVNAISTPNIDQPTGYLASIGYTSTANSFNLNFRYLLTGGAPNSADLAEVTTLTNRGNSNLVFTLFEYDFFAPGGVDGGTGTLLNSSTIKEANAAGSITVGATGVPNHWMIDSTSHVANSILSGGPLTDGTSGYSSVDLAFAFEWDIVVAPGQTWQMSKNKLLSVPEPASFVVLAGLAAVVVRRRRLK